MFIYPQKGPVDFLPAPPKKIISLVPSITETLYDLGLRDEVAGITKFCIHPSEWFKKKERVGGTKHVHLHRVKSINPDLVIANREENVKEQVEEIAWNYPVWLTDIKNLEDSQQMILALGELVQKQEQAKKITSRISQRFQKTGTVNSPLDVIYLIWKDPYMTVGGDSFIHDMLSRIGLVNLYEYNNRYPVVPLEVMKARKPDLLLLSTEPYPFSGEDVKEMEKQLPGTTVSLVDGEMFSWYGSRMLKSARYLGQLVEKWNKGV